MVPKNVLITGAGPVGLLTTIALLKQKHVKDLNVSNIYLVERSKYWRPQIFFIQNSYSYDTIDFIRDIDMETYKSLEKIGCFVGSPASIDRPYCYSKDGNSPLTQGKYLAPLADEFSSQTIFFQNINITTQSKSTT